MEEDVKTLKEAVESCPVCAQFAEIMDYAVCKALFPGDEAKQRRCQEIMRARREGRITLEQAERMFNELGVTLDEVQEAIESVEPAVKDAFKKKYGVDLE